MEAKLQKWGNSDGIRIPSSFLKLLNLKTNDKVDLKFEDDKIILEEKFKQYNGENLAKDFIWDKNQGKEIW